MKKLISLFTSIAVITALLANIQVFAQTSYSLPVIACWGDSLTFGEGSTNANTTNENSYPSVLSKLTGTQVNNMGVGGETSMTIAARTGAYDINLTKEITIPEDTSEVNVEFAAFDGDSKSGVVVPRDVNRGGWNPCTINGIDGVISISVNTAVWPRTLNWAKFKRTNPGTATICPVGTKITIAAQSVIEDADINIFFTGTNGGWNGNHTDANDNEYADLVNITKKMIESGKTGSKYLVIGLTTGDATQWSKTNQALALEFGDNFLDIKSYLATKQALMDAGINASQSDLTDIQEGKIPRSLLATDGTHMNDSGYRLLAEKVYEKLLDLGYLEENKSFSSLCSYKNANDFNKLQLNSNMFWAKSITTEYNIGGRRQDDAVCKVVAANTMDNANAIFFQKILTNNDTQSKLTFAVDFLPNDTLSSVSFATKGHAGLCNKVTSNDWIDNEWNRMVLSYDPILKNSKLYLNGKYISSSSNLIANNDFRLIFFINPETPAGEGYIQFDDLYVYSGDLEYPIIADSEYTIQNKKIHGWEGDTVQQLIDKITFADSECSIKVFANSGVERGMSELVNEEDSINVYYRGVEIEKMYPGIGNSALLNDVIVSTNGYISGNNKFSNGRITLTQLVGAYRGKNVFMALGQFDNADGTLKKIEADKKFVEGEENVSLSIDIDTAEGTYLKMFLWDADTLEPLAGTARVIEPYSSSHIEMVNPLYQGFTTKAVAFNYDDGVEQDIRMVELLNKYGIKGTFNLVSGRLVNNMTPAYEKAINEGTTSAKDIYAFIKEIYSGHEIANHTQNHYPAHLNPGQSDYDSFNNQLIGRTTEKEIADIVNCSTELKEWLGVEAIGLIWPNGYGTARNDYESDLLPAMKNVGLKYARAAETSGFDLPTDWYRWGSTCHHNNAPMFAEKFVSLENSGEMKCFFNWGHTYEFDNNKNDDTRNWTMIENVMKTLTAKAGEVWFAGNGDIYNYVEATKKLVVSDTTVQNHSDMTIYCQINGVNITIPAGETVDINDLNNK